MSNQQTQDTAPAPRVNPAPRVKIAIIGKAPSSRLIAPYDDPSWEVWSISDNYNVIPRWDRWFEIHDLDRYKTLYPEYYDWLSTRQSVQDGGFPLYVSEARDEVPAGIVFPWQHLTKRFGHYFTNSISWLIVFAIEEIEAAIRKQTGRPHVGPEDFKACGAAIGLWGVDMATASEYEHQRPSCEWFMGWARGLGIDVVVPDECDLVKTARLYAVESFRGDFDIKIRVRDHELTQRLVKAQHELQRAQQAAAASGGALEESRRIGQAICAAHPELADQFKQRIAEIEADHNNASQAAGQLTESVNMLRGAKEDLKWCRQYA